MAGGGIEAWSREAVDFVVTTDETTAAVRVLLCPGGGTDETPSQADAIHVSLTHL